MNSMHTSIPARTTFHRFAFRSLAAAIIVGCIAASAAAQGMLQTIRQDVRGESVPSSSAPSDDTRDDRDQCYDPHPWFHDHDGCCCENNQTASAAGDGASSCLGFFSAVGAIVFSPLWVPHAMLGDNFAEIGQFARFPYDGGAGYIHTSGYAGKTRPLAVRLDVEYAETFNRLESVNGHLLVETASRFGVAASCNHLEERLFGGGRDQLEIGNCNFVYRIAQNRWAECRTGLGFNWMNDAQRADFGFNFTYAVDVFPRNPWVLSAEIDAGTLGDTGLFQFRTTAGVVFHGVETYAGYEYTDIGRAHWNGLIAGLRLWF
jgi:hypothetical protein